MNCGPVAGPSNDDDYDARTWTQIIYHRRNQFCNSSVRDFGEAKREWRYFFRGCPKSECRMLANMTSFAYVKHNFQLRSLRWCRVGFLQANCDKLNSVFSRFSMDDKNWSGAALDWNDLGKSTRSTCPQLPGIASTATMLQRFTVHHSTQNGPRKQL